MTIYFCLTLNYDFDQNTKILKHYNSIYPFSFVLLLSYILIYLKHSILPFFKLREKIICISFIFRHIYTYFQCFSFLSEHHCYCLVSVPLNLKIILQYFLKCQSASIVFCKFLSKTSILLSYLQNTYRNSRFLDFLTARVCCCCCLVGWFCLLTYSIF